MKPAHAGFTLVEVVVALAILAISLAAAARAGMSTADGTAELRARVAAQWVAENRIAGHIARDAWLPAGRNAGSAIQAGLEFAWQETVSDTPVPSLRRIDVAVVPAADPARVLARASGFLQNRSY